MSPYERMARKYRDNPQECPFEYYLNWHLKHGFVFSTPEFFVMGRSIVKSQPEKYLSPIAYSPRGLADCWYVHALAGDVSKVWDILPYPLGWIAFERVREGKRELTFIETERMRSLCQPNEVLQTA